MRAKVAEADAERAVVQKRNELRRVKAELEGEAKSAEERAEQGGLAARATAEQALQAVRRELEAVRLQAEVVVPSEINREAAALQAAGQAATIAGRRQVEVIGEFKNLFNTEQVAGVNQTFPVTPLGVPTVPLLTTGDEFKDAGRVTSGFEQRAFQLGFKFYF